MCRVFGYNYMSGAETEGPFWQHRQAVFDGSPWLEVPEDGKFSYAACGFLDAVAVIEEALRVYLDNEISCQEPS